MTDALCFMAVFVSSLVVDEIKKIIKESEIMKYVWQLKKG
jgi:hypothetical protein